MEPNKLVFIILLHKIINRGATWSKSRTCQVHSYIYLGPWGTLNQGMLEDSDLDFYSPGPGDDKDSDDDDLQDDTDDLEEEIHVT